MKNYIVAGIACLLLPCAAFCEPSSNRLALAAQVAGATSAELAAEIVNELAGEMDLTTNAQSAMRDFAEAVVPAIQKEAIRVLADSFTADELKVLIRFNSLQPVLSERCMRAMEAHLKQNPELTKELASRLKKASGAQQHGGQISSEGAPSAPPNESSP